MDQIWGGEKEIRKGILPIISGTINEIKDSLTKHKQEAKEKIKPLAFQSISQIIAAELGILPETEFKSLSIQEQYYNLCFVGHMFKILSNPSGILEDKKFKLDGGLRNKLDRSVRPASLTFPEIYTPDFPEESIEMSKRKDITWEARNLSSAFITTLKDEGTLGEFIYTVDSLVNGGKQKDLVRLRELVKIARQSIHDPERKIDPISKSIALLNPSQAA